MQPDSCFVGEFANRDLKLTSSISPSVDENHADNILTGSGLWGPEADALALLRDDIDQNSSRLKAVLKGPEMRDEILNGTPDDGEKAVKAFLDQNKESALKTKPKVSAC